MGANECDPITSDCNPIANDCDRISIGYNQIGFLKKNLNKILQI